MDIVRAWKDEEYRLSLSEEQRALLPDNPAGLMELSDADLASIAGGTLGTWFCSSLCLGTKGCGGGVTYGVAVTCGVAITCGKADCRA